MDNTVPTHAVRTTHALSAEQISLINEGETGTEGIPMQSDIDQRFMSWRVQNKPTKRPSKKERKAAAKAARVPVNVARSQAATDRNDAKIQRRKIRRANKAALRKALAAARLNNLEQPMLEARDIHQNLEGLSATAFGAQTKPLAHALGEPKKPQFVTQQQNTAKQACFVAPQRVHKQPPQCPTNNYSETRAHLNIAVASKRCGNITNELADDVLREIQLQILAEAMSSNPGFAPQFTGKPKHSQGVLKLWCMTEYTVEWTKKVVSAMSTDEELVVLRQDELAHRVRCCVLIPDDKGFWKDAKDIASTLSFQNNWAGVDRWWLQNAEKQQEGWFLKLTVPENVVPTLLARQRRLSFGCGSVYVKFLGKGGKYFMEPPHIPGSPSRTLEIPTRNETNFSSTVNKMEGEYGEPKQTESEYYSTCDEDDNFVQRMLAEQRLWEEGESLYDGVPFVSS